MSKQKSAPSAPRRKNQTIDHAAFIKAWQAGETVTAVAEKLGWEAKRASSTARFLRSKGLKLKLFKRGMKIDVEALRKLL